MGDDELNIFKRMENSVIYELIGKLPKDTECTHKDFISIGNRIYVKVGFNMERNYLYVEEVKDLRMERAIEEGLSIIFAEKVDGC